VPFSIVSNQLAFDRAVDHVTRAAQELLDFLVTKRAAPLLRSRGGNGSGKVGTPAPLI